MVQVSRVFTTGISRNKEIHLKVLIEDDSKIWVILYLVFYPQDCSRSTRETEILRTLYKARSGFSILTEEYLTFQTVSCKVSDLQFAVRVVCDAVRNLDFVIGIVKQR